MANKGLKKYTKNLRIGLNNVVKTYTNLCKFDSNVIIEIPLLETYVLSPMKLSLYFNYQNRNELGLFGYGVKSNFYSFLTWDQAGFHLKNPDGTIDDYATSGAYNLETQKQMRIEEDDEDTYYVLSDRYNNNITYYDTGNGYANLYEYINGESYSVIRYSNYFSILNGKGDQIKLNISNNLITSVEYYKNNSLKYKATITYSNSFISGIKIYCGTNLIEDISFILEYSNMLSITDNLSDDSIVFAIIGGLVTEVSETHNSYTKNTTSFSYDNNMTTVTSKGEEYKYLFNNDGLFLYEYDNLKNIIKEDYDKTKKVVLSRSNFINYFYDTNIFNDLTIASLVNHNLTITSQTETNIFYNSMFGNTVYHLSGTGYLDKERDFNGAGLDNINLYLFGKNLILNNSDSYVKVTLTLDKEITKKFDNSNLNNNFYDLIFLGVNANNNYNKIKIKIELSNASIIIGGLKLVYKSIGQYFEYNDSGNVIRVNNNSINYNNANMRSYDFGENINYNNYTYNNSMMVTNVNSNYGVKNDITYNLDNQKTGEKLSNSNNTKILEKRYVYTNNFLTSIIRSPFHF